MRLLPLLILAALVAVPCAQAGLAVGSVQRIAAEGVLDKCVANVPASICVDHIGLQIDDDHGVCYYVGQLPTDKPCSDIFTNCTEESPCQNPCEILIPHCRGSIISISYVM
jgi:hypothetical protein